MLWRGARKKEGEWEEEKEEEGRKRREEEDERAERAEKWGHGSGRIERSNWSVKERR